MPRRKPGIPLNVSTKLRSGGSVALAVHVDLVTLAPADREWFFGLLDYMRGYEQAPRGEVGTEEKG